LGGPALRGVRAAAPLIVSRKPISCSAIMRAAVVVLSAAAFLVSEMLLLGGADAQTSLPVGESTHVVTGAGGRSSVVTVTVPAAALEAPVPLVMGLHGWFGNGPSFCSQNDMLAKSESLRFIGVCVTGDGSSGENSWNAAGCCGTAAAEGVDDVSYLRAVVGWVGARAELTSNYALGHSNGAMMVYRLLCEAPDLFSGVAPVNGGYYGAPPSFLVATYESVPNGWRTAEVDCGPVGPDFPLGSGASRCWTADSFPSGDPTATPVGASPLLTINGEDDTEEPYALVVAQYRYYAVQVLGCDPESEEVVFSRGQSTCSEYTTCPPSGGVAPRPALCSVAGLGHGMPSLGQHGIDSLSIAIDYWRGAWPDHWPELGANEVGIAGGGTPLLVQCPDTADCTEAVQRALDHPVAAHVMIPATDESTPWQVEPLFIRRSNLTLSLAPGAVLQAKKGSFRGTSDSLLTIEFASNVTILGTGATLKMRKLEYLPPAYVKAEWRMGVQIRGCDSVRVFGLTVQDAGGDGFYIADTYLQNYSSNVLLEGVIADGSWRNGLSVISAIGLIVRNSTFSNTNGTNPQFGIDLEPDTDGHRLQGIVFENVSLLDNARGGWTIGPYALVDSGVPVDVTITDMLIRGAPGVPWGGREPVAGAPPEYPDGPQLGGIGLDLDDGYNLTGSSLTISGLEIRDTAGPAISVGNWPNGVWATLLRDVHIENCSTFVVGSRPGFVGPGKTPEAFGPVPPIMVMPTGGNGKDENSSSESTHCILLARFARP
jgi:poly(3-hydroxybutyrate) depolymerase